MSQVRLFQDARALDSLRSSDFDAVSAYGEVVDNSIEADAKHVRIRFFTKLGKYNYHHIQRLAFGDDGKGMSADTLHNCMQIGWSSRYNNRDGIGRFGVGMTMAAIHECKRVDVWSKETGSQWLHTYIDLDAIAGGEDMIPEPSPKALPADCKNLVGQESGTLVVWSKYDRQEANADALIEDAKVWMGRTYRYFMWDDDVEIYVNGELVKAIDPLYGETKGTRFTEDPKAKVYTPMTIDWKVDELDAPENAPEVSEITVRFSVLPEEFRPKQGSGGAKEALDRHIDKNEGVSILRARREVFYGHIPYWSAAGTGWPRFEEKDRWWGCEIEFNPVLDRAFTVKNIKRGAVPETELKKALHELLKPSRTEALREVDRVWQNYKIQEEQKKSEEDVQRPGDHREAEQVVRETKTDRSRIDEKKDFDEEADKLVSRYEDRYNEQQRQKLKELFKAQDFTIMEEHWRGSMLFEVTHLGGSSVLEYNRNHPFWDLVYDRLDKAGSDGGDAAQAARDLKALLDLLLIAYGKAETRFGEDDEMKAGDILSQLRTNIGQYLMSYVSTWRKNRKQEQV